MSQRRGFLTIMKREFHIPVAIKRFLRKKLRRVQEHKTRTQACIRCPVWRNATFHWEDPYLNMDAVFRPRIDKHCFSLFFNKFVMSLMAENLILIDSKQDKENTLPLQVTPVSERPTLKLCCVLMRSRPFGTKFICSPLCLLLNEI